MDEKRPREAAPLSFLICRFIRLLVVRPAQYPVVFRGDADENPASVEMGIGILESLDDYDAPDAAQRIRSYLTEGRYLYVTPTRQGVS